MKSFAVRTLEISSPEDAELELKRVGVDPSGILRMAPKMQLHCLHISNLQCRQANIIKQEMLSLGGDAAVARGTVACSIENTNVIVIGNDKQLRLLSEKLLQQPFGLPVLSLELTRILTDLKSPPQAWRTSQRTLSLKRPLIMGILNITPDSFSDENHYIDPKQAFDRALEMLAEGADIIDIGGESTRPGAVPVDIDEEKRRIIPVIEALAGKISCPISVDTWKSVVADTAMTAGAEIINDISGFTFDPAIAAVAAKTGAGTVLMHTRGTPQNMQSDTCYHDMVAEIYTGLANSIEIAESAGVERDRITIDPGIGFAKNTAGNLELLKRLAEFSGLGLPLLVGPSRKSFIGNVLDRQPNERIFGTSAVIALSVYNGASVFRVHDVRAMRDAADMAHAVMTA